MLDELRARRIIVPGPTTVGRTRADALVDALVDAERLISRRIADRLGPDVRARLAKMLSACTDDDTSRFVWLRRHEPGGNSADANQLLDRLEWLAKLAVPSEVVDGIPPHRIARPRRQGERYCADGLREVPKARRLAILAACAVEWRATLADAIVETHERITGRLYRQAQRTCTALVADRKGAIAETLRSFAARSGALVQAHAVGGDMNVAVAQSVGWEAVARLAATAKTLTAASDADPIDHLGSGTHRFCRYAPRMLKALDPRGGRSAEPLLRAIDMLRDLNRRGRTELPCDPPTAFASPKGCKRLVPSGTGVDRRMGETAVLFALRDALRSGGVWLAHSHRHHEPGCGLVPAAAVTGGARLAVPLNAADWIASRHGPGDPARVTVAPPRRDRGRGRGRGRRGGRPAPAAQRPQPRAAG